MKIFRGRRLERLYRDWTKYAGLPHEDVYQTEPPAKMVGVSRLPLGLVIYLMLGAALLFILVGLVMLLLTRCS